jgi:L-ascorbate metabolism protein UlaG (beta-lactamase superfamily)
MMPEEVARVAEELRAKALLPAHGGKFCIANHAWDEPFKRLAEASRGKSYRLLTPKIGEPVKLDDPQQRFPPWWEGIG